MSSTEPVTSSSDGLQARGITVRYGGVVANQDVSISVPPGQIVGLIGPNGAGKTSFVDALTGFAKASGEISMGGRRIDSLRPHQRRAAGLSRTWQSGELFASLTVAENILAGARPPRPSTIFRDLFLRHDPGTAMVERALEIVGLPGSGGVRAGDLTLGQQKLVGVARALAGGCSTLLLDEPAAGLDSAESEEFAGRIRRIVDTGPGALLIDHDMGLVLSVCDTIYVLEFGKLIFRGTADEARNDPAVIAAYLGVPIEANHG
ncbi:amino acid/amide ABC transporter ATP-binding protein 1 (HAAT family) [Jatrophihabitans sp. GAS493]|uniref:ABC transporter ATP-binding protein n=1 Tax=Jatrophihabitans sp. GAS493 TaxID=1907575 RepID=UPI000BB87083|nr:ABC transporter ATP-binding protein [Jatrophihabitans sp. GAS493]SOD74624.1 amino acid/amide ABC transporter ATP-binding protein 1 (HAAT family) [Jatrophihabitans sp. GAS493]